MEKLSLEIPEQFHVCETTGWLVNHRINSALPGYLMISSRSFTNDLSELSPEALSELGPLLAKAQKALGAVLGAKRVYIGRYGHMPGYPIHFHIIPSMTGWKRCSGRTSATVCSRPLPKAPAKPRLMARK